MNHMTLIRSLRICDVISIHQDSPHRILNWSWIFIPFAQTGGQGGGMGGGNPETGDDSYIYNGEGIGQQPTEGYDGNIIQFLINLKSGP